MLKDAYIQLRTALDTTTETIGGDTRTGVGAVFIQKVIDRMIVEVRNKTVDFSPHVRRKTIRQNALIWDLKTSLGSTSKSQFYSDGGTGTPYPSQYLQLVASVKALRSDYEVTGLTIAAASSYFEALESEARSALQSHALTEEQAFILGDDTSSESTGLTINGQVGVTGAYKGLKQLLDSAVAVAAGSTGGFANASSVYGLTRSATSTDRQYALNVKTVATSVTATNPLSIANLNDAITESDIAGGKFSRRIFLVSERRMNRISDLLSPGGRFVYGASATQLDGGVEVLSWRGVPIISTRLMALFGVTSTDGSSVTFVDTDNCVLLLDMDNIEFNNVAGIDTIHKPVDGTDTSQRSDILGGYFRTYGVFLVKKFNTHVVIWNLAIP